MLQSKLADTINPERSPRHEALRLHATDVLPALAAAARGCHAESALPRVADRARPAQSVAGLALGIQDLQEPLGRETLIALLGLACDEMARVNMLFARIRQAGEARLLAAV